MQGAANTRHRHEMARSSVISYTSKCIRVTATPGYTADEDAEAEMRKTEGGGCEPVENIQIEQCWIRDSERDKCDKGKR